MKLIKPSFEILEQDSTLQGVYKQIEIAGRTCYKSEDKITENSAKEFADRMIASNHTAMLEHGTVYLRIREDEFDIIGERVFDKYLTNKYSTSSTSVDGLYYQFQNITTNYRVLIENGWMDDLKYMCKPTEFHEKRVTVKFIMDRIGSQSFCRHRVFSFAQESTRYCNYSKKKFCNELTFIIPNWLQNYNNIINKFNNRKIIPFKDIKKELFYEPYNQSDMMDRVWLYSMLEAEYNYIFLVNSYIPAEDNSKNWTPQQARAVLPNSLKTELVMTGFISDWKHFFKLRDDSHAHPQAQELAKPLHEEFIKRKYINE